MISHCISLMVSDDEHFFMYLLGIYMSSLENVYSRFLVHFSMGCLGFWLLGCVSSLSVLDISALPDTWFANIFYHSGGCLFLLKEENVTS